MLFNQKTIRWKLFLYYFLLFTIFIVSIIFYQNRREQHFRVTQLETTLDRIYRNHQSFY